MMVMVALSYCLNYVCDGDGGVVMRFVMVENLHD